MAGKGKQKNRRKATPAKSKTNVWDAVIKLIDALYNLINTGNIVGAIVLGLLFWVYQVTSKVPDDVIGQLLLDLFRQEFLYIFPMSVVIAVSVSANFLQWKTYGRHIKHHSELRKTLMHGLAEGTLKPLKNHNTSDLDIYVENNTSE